MNRSCIYVQLLQNSETVKLSEIYELSVFPPVLLVDVSLYCVSLLASTKYNSSVGVATRYVLGAPGVEPRLGGGSRFSVPVETGPRAHPTSCTMDTVSFPGVKRPGRGVDHPSTPSSAEVKETVDLYIYSPSAPSWPVKR